MHIYRFLKLGSPRGKMSQNKSNCWQTSHVFHKPGKTGWEVPRRITRSYGFRDATPGSHHMSTRQLPALGPAPLWARGFPCFSREPVPAASPPAGPSLNKPLQHPLPSPSLPEGAGARAPSSGL